MKKSEYISKVKEFHDTFKIPILNSPAIPDEARAKLRVDLLQEELNELQEAIKNGDLVEVADAFSDLQYVLSGAILEFGLADKFKELFDEVHRSNMSKACDTEEEARDTIEHYKNDRDTECYFKQIDDKYIVLRWHDDKLLKSVKYSPANIAKILEE